MIRSLLCWIVAFVSPFFFFIQAIFCYISNLDTPIESYMQDGSRQWARLLLKITGITITVKNEELLNDIVAGKMPVIVASNHSSFIDILVLLKCLPFRCVFFAKNSVFIIPGYGWYMWGAGHIPVNRSNARSAYRSLQIAGEKLKKGTSLVIFPEGSRSLDGNIQRFKNGFVRIAEMSGAPILPVSIKGTNNIMQKGSIILKPAKVTVNIGKLIYTEQGKTVSNDARSELTLLVQRTIESMLNEA